MNIPSDRVLTEIERHLERVRPEDAGHVRETLAAIRALCDIVLEDQPPQRPQQPVPAPRPAPQSSVQPAAPRDLYETPLQEDDANGDSLFDF
ncbi:YwdI family protein [Planococcus lenghuensis]|uniref:Uncharacterized protein n=1 Tax=Planococcus lenghuensis TaxID=2213202 RepID=A0A1Q2L1M9_9BACL|nr:YwdI family protein [Planococcus lenghuensis]AQQ54331.1 hypothetical protein B0X71_15315 [Planococcus lenghuensis]